MSNFILKVSSKLPWSTYLRLLTNFIIESTEMGREDIEQYVREYERSKPLLETEKQLMARTKAFLMALFGRAIIDWPTFVVFARCLKATRLRVSVTLYTEASEKTFTIETKLPGDETDDSVS